jgi:tryptophanyl-tRNA synthetase
MSGTRTTGALHLGHYLGWLSNCLKLQNEYQCFFGVMDWHGMTSAYKTADQIKSWNRDIFAEILAWGLNCL